MATNPAAKMVGALITRAVVPVLKPLGFKRSGTTFRRELDECIQVVNVQSSQWNSREGARFTINLGVFFPAVHAELDDFFRASIAASGPLEYQCHLRLRLGQLTADERDTWWLLRPGEPDDAAAAAIEAALRGPALAWFERFRTPDSLLAAPRDHEQPVTTLIGVALAKGQERLARELARALFEERPDATALRGWLVRRGLVDT